MSKTKEIRIRKLTPAEHKRIGLAAKEQDLSASCFCLYAALDKCDKHDAEQLHWRSMHAKGAAMECTDKEAVNAYRRVLRLVNVYLRKQRQDLLVTDGRGFQTWGEIRSHIQGSLSLQHPLRVRGSKKPKGK